MTSKPFYRAGQWVESAEIHEVRNQSAGGTLARVCRASRDDILAAIAAASASLNETRRLPSHARSEVLAKIAAALKERHEEFSRLICLEAGKPICTARQETDRAILTYTLGAEEATRLNGELLPLDQAPAGEGRWGLVRRVPIGPVAAITPFNFPLNLVAHKVSPALAAGCPVIVRPSSTTPLSALALAEIIHESGWPKGAFSVLPCSTDAAEPLIADERIKLLTFTGSPAVGWPLKARAGKKRVSLELGGNAGVIIHSDADLKDAARRVAAGAFGYAGQSCISVQRVFVHQPAWHDFLHLLMSEVHALVTGDPADEKTDVGPMIDVEAVRKIESWVVEAVQAGAHVLTGGKRHDQFFEPTVLTGTTAEMRICAEEAFAPIMTVSPYEAFEDAVRAVDHGRYGLQCGVFTRDLERIWKAFEEIEVGGVIVNDVPTWRMDSMPYGGVKDSGFGREGLRYAIEEMTERKLLVLKPH